MAKATCRNITPTPDPVFDLIAAHRHAVAAYNKSSAADDSPEQEALGHALGSAEEVLLRGASTMAGWEALILYATRQPSLHGHLEQLATGFSAFISRRDGALLSIDNWQPQNLPKENLTATLEANSKDAKALIALYDAYQAAADAILLVENQPRAKDVQEFLSDEASSFKEAAHRIGAVLAAMPEVKHNDAGRRAKTLFNCALDMGFELDRATKVLMEATTTLQVA